MLKLFLSIKINKLHLKYVTFITKKQFRNCLFYTKKQKSKSKHQICFFFGVRNRKNAEFKAREFMNEN